MADEQRSSQDGSGAATAERTAETLTVTDNRTGETYELEITDGTVQAMDLRQIKVSRGRLRADGLRPGVHEHGLLPLGDHLHRRRGGDPPAPRLLDRAALRALELPRGRLPARLRRAADRRRSSSAGSSTSPITPSSTRTSSSLLETFRYDAHPMGMLLSSVGALSTFYPDAKQIDDPEERYMAAIRLIAKVPTLAAFAYRHNMGLPYVYPDNDLSYAENFLSMMFKKTEVKYEPDPRLAKALDVLFILHADHEQNCSTNAVRGGRLLAGRPVLGGRGRGRGALRPAARRRQRGGAADAAADRDDREHPRLPRGGEEPRGAADGLRAPRLQELRPAGADHQEARRRGARGNRRQPAARHRGRAREARPRRRVLHLAQALPERRLLLGADLRGAARSRPRCSR